MNTTIKDMTEKELSKRNQPNYFKWLWQEKKSKIALTIVGIIASIYVTPIVIAPENENPIAIIILALIAVYGFTIGITLQPYSIYRNLVKVNYWSPNSPWKR
jgi:hypothetical protein